MRKILIAICLVALLSPSVAQPHLVTVAHYQRPAMLKNGWQTADPESLGVDSAALEKLTATIRAKPELNVHAVLIA